MSLGGLRGELPELTFFRHGRRVTEEFPIASHPSQSEDAAETAEMSSSGQTGGSSSSRSLARSIFQLAAGRGAAVAIGVLAAPIVTRLYSPTEFGVLMVLTTVVTTLASCASLSYDMAMPLAESLSQRRALLVLVLAIGMFLSALLAMITLLWGDEIAIACGKPELAKYGLFVPLLFLAATFGRAVTVELSCQKRFGKVALYELIRRAGTAASQIAAGVGGLAKTPTGLLLGALVGSFAGALALAPTPLRSLLRSRQEPLRIADVRAAAVQFKKFPLIQSWGRLFNTLSMLLPVYVIGFLFSEHSVGVYGIARQLLVVPVIMFTASGGQVFYVHAAQSVAQGNSVESETSSFLRLLVLFTAFPFTIVLLLGPLLFEVTLGQEWREAGVYAQLLTPWIATMAIGSPLSSMLLAKSKLGESFVYSIVLFVVRLAGLIVGSVFVGPKTAIALFAIGNAFVYGHLTVRTLKLADVGRRWAGLFLIGSYLKAALLLAPAVLLYWWADMKIAALVALAAACLAHAGLLYLRHPRIGEAIRRLVTGDKAPDPCRTRT